ncbi:hypothetical protein D3C81_1865280 [compost metagenome]
MGLADAEDHGLLFTIGVQFVGQFVADHLVETRCNDTTVKRFDIEAELILQYRSIDFAVLNVDDADRIPLIKVDTMFGQLGFIPNWRLMIDQPVVCHSLTITVGEHWLTKNFTGVLGWRSCQSDPTGIEVVENPSVLR